ncbi:hypothetical protein C7N43_01845 [Sphingobacteriales bacterium UPWRP_1]|nr:hypothetical protein B6N25_15190 [Sphingobacteriales bacterium TSM_CSS]PSJ78768.1 hypothetical protein C7N43_01845 [Sphingobacteriales bacterium UPWRP_1]
MKLAWLHILIIRSACKVALSVPQSGWRHLSGWFLPGVGLVAACCLLQISCSRNPNTNSAPNKTTKEAEAGKTNLPDAFTATLAIGSGGGFTGGTVRYIIPPDGKVTRIRTKVPQDTTVLKQLSEKELTTLQHDALKLRLNQMSFRFPGNLYYFIEYSDKDLTNTITWGDRNNPVPPDVQDFYNRAMTLIIGEE